MRRFVEHDHPRWPRGTGDKAGEFRDKTPDWADRVSTSLPIAGGGSVPTGLESRCPVCGRNLKVVGNGKLSTHNRPRNQGGGRCAGSGQPVTPDQTHQEYTTRIPRQRSPRRTPDSTRPPASPPHPDGKPQDPVRPIDQGAHQRMAVWRDQAHAVNARWARHQAELYKLEAQAKKQQEKADQLQIHLDRGYQFYTQHDRARAEEHLSTTRSQIELRRRMQAENPEFDPSNPLAYYGDMLHIEDDSIHTYVALDALEQHYPPILHRIAAEYLGGTNDGGIWIGAKPLPELDDMRRRLAGSKPGGDWKGDTRGWAAPDGVVSSGRHVAVGYSANTESHRVTRRQQYGRPDVDASAASHEFGHLLDRAIGYAEHGRYRKEASEQRLFRLIYGRVKRDAGNRLQPHFRQRGDAGPSEVWAEGLEIWGNGGTQQTSAPGYGHLTRREFAAIQKFRIEASTAKDLMAYYDRLFGELESGRRLAYAEQRVG